jgi:NRAMP (natural resistance-associated macrophage protein)-like metal ion transporter
MSAPTGAGGPSEAAGGDPGASAPPRPAPGRAPAVLDSAHVGDIEGALGRISLTDSSERRTRRQRLLTLLAIVGPGLIVMVGDNDAGGVATYAQAGQNYGTSLLWVLLLLIPVLIVNQEMVVRLGTVTGVGHARLINERFGRFWGAFSVGDLFILNFLTIVTEFIGVALGADYFGVSHYLAVPVAAVTLVAITASGSFRRFERAMLGFIGISFVLYPMALLSHPQWSRVAHDFVVPGIQGGINSAGVLLIIAIVGTTVAPWQLFFQQSNVIDKRITPRFINYERADTAIGSVVVVVGAAALMVASDYAFRSSSLHGHFSDALGVAQGLGRMGHALGTLFSVALLDAAIVGAVAVTLATSYAFGDVFNMRHSLHRGWREAKKFYGSYTAMVVLAGAIVLIPGAPLGLITTSVQALAGLLLPSASVFLLLLCNDPEVLGPWVNQPWLNALATAIIGVLLVLSGVLMASTLFPSLDVTHLFIELSLALAVLGLGGMGYVRLAGRGSRSSPPVEELGREDKMAWRMPQLTLLQPVRWSPGLRLGMSALRAYLVISAVLLVVKAVRLGH